MHGNKHASLNLLLKILNKTLFPRHKAFAHMIFTISIKTHIIIYFAVFLSGKCLMKIGKTIKVSYHVTFE